MKAVIEGVTIEAVGDIIRIRDGYDETRRVTIAVEETDLLCQRLQEAKDYLIESANS
jgi:hypothetical protein